MFSWSWCSISWNGLPFLPVRIEIEKAEKLAANLHDKSEYVIHTRNLKQALNHGLVLRNYTERLKSIKKLGYNHVVIWILT